MNLKKVIKKSFIGDFIKNYHYSKSPFSKFEKKISKDTYKISKNVLKWADESVTRKSEFESIEKYTESENLIVMQSYKMRTELERKFHGLRKDSKLRILVHLPDPSFSPAGYSIFKNMIESASYLDYKIEPLGWNDSTSIKLKEFKPNVFITSDSSKWLNKIDWNSINEYRRVNELVIGLTASLEEEGNSALRERLKWAKENGVSFYYGYEPEEYLEERKEDYSPFTDAGYPLFSYEYMFNPLNYYPIPNIKRDINYIMLGSGYNNCDKRQIYIDWLSEIWKESPGFIYGPGWRRIKFQGINSQRDRYLYSRGKIGLNLSIPRQLKWHASLNERTYMLAACGIPQLSDNAKLLVKRFDSDEVCIAENPKEYKDYFYWILENEQQALEMALKAQKKVYESYTNFHTADSFLCKVESMLQS